MSAGWLAELDQPAAPAQDAVQARHDELAAALLDDAGMRQIPAPEPVVDGWLYRDSIAWLHGKPGKGKTFVAVDIAGCVGNGIAWHGHDVTQGRVLYLIAEGARGLSRRVEAWKLANGALSSGITFLPIAVQMLDARDLAAFAAVLREVKPVLVVIDTQARTTVGAEENSAKDMGLFVDALEQLRAATGACILVVHHESRSGETLRGSTALEGAATSIIACAKDGPQLTLDNPKQKDAPEQPAKILALAPIGDSAVVSHEAVGLIAMMTESQHLILATLRDQFGTNGASTTKLLDACGVQKTTFYRSLAALKERGLVTEQRTGRTVTLKPASLDGQQQVPLVPTGPTEPAELGPRSHTPLRGGTGETYREPAPAQRVICENCGAAFAGTLGDPLCERCDLEQRVREVS